MSNTEGSYNAFFGDVAGFSNTTGSNNTVIGTQANVGAIDLTNATAIGSKALVSQNNSLVLGSINGLNSATSDTNVGIGTTSPGFKLHIMGHTTHDWPIIKLQNVDSGGHSYWLYSGANGVPGDFGIYDESASGYRFYIRGTNGNVGIGTTDPQAKLAVNRDAQISGNLATNGNFVFAPLPESNPAWISPIFNGIAALGSCGSSLRFKSDMRTFSGGMDIVNRLRPIGFAWRKDGRRDIGLAAEEVEMVEPLLTFRNGKGEVEGVRYNQLSAIFINAFKEQQSLIEQQKKQIDQQRNEIYGLKKLVCLDHPKAEICEQATKP